MSFLNRTNFDHVFGIASQYLQDTNTLFVTQEELQRIVADTMKHIQASKDANKETIDVEKWNRLTILTVRDLVRQKKPAVANVTEDVVVNERELETDLNVGDPFFTKLQELQVTRKSGNVWMQTETASAATAPTSTPTPQPSAGPTVTTIYMQAPPEKGTAIHIRSWHRSWRQSPLRASFSWQGPYPVGMDLNTMYVSTVIVPKQTMAWTPYVILEIEGAGGQVNECIMIPDTKSVSNVWEYLRPSSRSIGYIRPLALPWKIRVLDADRELLPYGKDQWKVQDIQHIRDISRLRVACVVTSLAKDFVTNEWLLLMAMNGDEVRCKIVAVGPSTIDVDETIDIKFANADILHLHRQTCIILETKK